MNVGTLLDELKVCSCNKDLIRGKELHAQAMESGNVSYVYVANSLVNMYAKCGSMVEARQVFEAIKEPTVVSWNTLILGYAVNGEPSTALVLFAKMKSQGYAPNSLTYVSALKACTSWALNYDRNERVTFLQQGKAIHSEIGRCHCDVYVHSSLIDMYANCGSLADAHDVFDSIKYPNVVAWNVLILGYAENGEGVSALYLFARMRWEGCQPSYITFIAALKACSALQHEGYGRSECRGQGKEVHSQIGCHLNIKVQNTLIDMYAKCGYMDDAQQAFDTIERPNVVSWNALISGYVENGEGVTALKLFASMRSQGCAPNCITFVAALKASGLLVALECGKKIHAGMDQETEQNEIVATCLVDFYSKCGSMIEAQKVCDSHPKNMITWNALLAGYSRLGDNKTVFRVFNDMLDTGFQPDSFTLLCVLTCCCNAGLVGEANKIFENMSTTYQIVPTIELYTCMVDICARWNQMDAGMALVRCMPCRPSGITWMTVLGACSKCKNVGIGRLAFKSLVSFDDGITAAYLLMSRIYGSRGMWEEQEMMRKNYEASEMQGKSCWINELGEAHSFPQAKSFL